MGLMLSGGWIYKGEGFSRGDIFIKDGIVVDILPPDVSGDARGFTPVFYKDMYIIPGFADVHVHLRQPGFSYKETIKTGTMAGARGGYTALCTMPNLNPVPDSEETLKLQTDIIDRDALIKVYPYASITKEQKGETLTDFAGLKDKVVGFSDDGKGVQRDFMMESAMTKAKENDVIIAAHCEDEALLFGGYIHKGKYAAAHGHKGIGSDSEYVQVRRDIELVQKTGCRYHICHVSTKESVEAIRQAKARGLSVTAETAPHYLLLTEDDLREDGSFKMNPPLRTAKDKQALIDGIIDGTLDIIATDHAPHSIEEKSKGLEGSAFGVVGLETAFPVLYTELVLTGLIPLHRLIQLMSDKPREVFRLPGGLTPGQPADIAILDLSPSYTIDPESFLSMGRSTPFAGRQVRGRVQATYCDGKKVFEYSE